MIDCENQAAGERPKVHLFDHTLIWPVMLYDCERGTETRRSRQDKLGDGQDEWQSLICSTGKWKHVSARDVPHDDTKRPFDVEHRQPYEEVVYFHPFVRKFLYDRPYSYESQAAARAADEDREFDGGVELYERDDVCGVKVSLYRSDIEDETQRTRRLTLGVTKVQLFLFDTFVAMLAIRLTNRLPPKISPMIAKAIHDAGCDALSLDDVLAFQEVFRRAYPPYWFGPRDSINETPGYMPSSLEWMDSDGQVIAARQTENPKASSNAEQQRSLRAFVHRTVQSPVVAHYQYLMHPLIPYEFHAVEPNAPRWLAFRQILDERIPVMSYLAVDDPLKLTEADWFRLTFCDSPGRHPGIFPYSAHSPDVAAFPDKYCYDRYWGPKYREGDTTIPEGDRDVARMTTRYLCSGFAFAVVGKYSSDTHDMFSVHIREHMQHHYFKLGLIAHFGRASLLAFDDRLALAVQYLPSGKEEEFRERVKRLEWAFVTFRSRYWFSEVSNHLQGRELFDWWAGHLEVDSLFQQVQGKIDTVANSIERRETGELNDQVKFLTTWSLVLAASALAASLVSISNDSQFWTYIVDDAKNRAMAVVVASIGLACLAGSMTFRWTQKYFQRPDRR